MMRRVLLLNPPGDHIYVRDYYCSKVSKAHYLYHPLDLLIMSGTISAKHEIRIIDGMIEGWTEDSVAKSIRFFKPDIVIFMTGVVSYIEDLRMIGEWKAENGFMAVATGELFLDDPVEAISQFPVIDAAILDFTSPGILELIDRIDDAAGFKPGGEIANIVYRSEDRIIGGKAIRGRGEEYEIAIPRHELFPNHKYRYPFVRRFPFATILTDFGCPYHCKFCAIGQLGYKIRKLANVLEELKLVKKLGFQDIYFDDQTFGATRDRTEHLLEEMIRMSLGIGFICFTRADVVDREFLKLMKKAGCHTVVFGVESKTDEALRKASKGLTLSHIQEAVSWCQTLKIRTVGTFVVGLPGQTASEADELGDFAIELGLDFASFNVPAPRPGTDLRRIAIEKGWISKELRPMDQSGSYAVMGNEHMTPEMVLESRNKASRRFYLRPSYLLKRLLGIRTFYEFKSHIREMSNLIHPKRFEKKH